jgi:hypothetical protein
MFKDDEQLPCSQQSHLSFVTPAALASNNAFIKPDEVPAALAKVL